MAGLGGPVLAERKREVGGARGVVWVKRGRERDRPADLRTGSHVQAQTDRQKRTHLLERAMAPHSSTLAWKIPWTEEPGRLQSMGSSTVRHD